MDRIDWNITEKIKKEVFMEKSENKVNVGTKKFNAVDLITVVVFAALVRVLWMVFKTAGVIFPFNHSFMHFFSSFCLVACISVVQKRGAAFYYTVGWCAINFFLQGEHFKFIKLFFSNDMLDYHINII